MENVNRFVSLTETCKDSQSCIIYTVYQRRKRFNLNSFAVDGILSVWANGAHRFQPRMNCHFTCVKCRHWNGKVGREGSVGKGGGETEWGGGGRGGGASGSGLRRDRALLTSMLRGNSDTRTERKREL